MTVNICVDLYWEAKALLVGSTAKNWTQELNTGRLCSAPGLREVFFKITEHPPLPAVSLSSSCLCRLIEPAIFQFSPNPSRCQFYISSSYHHNPFSLLKAPEILFVTSAFESGSSSVPEDSSCLDSPAALDSCAARQSSLQPATSCAALSGYAHSQWHLSAKPYEVSTEHVHNVIIKSQ